jgi:hypothetical protein
MSVAVHTCSVFNAAHSYTTANKNETYRESEVRQLANWIESVDKISRELTIESRKAAAMSDSEDTLHMVRLTAIFLNAEHTSSNP